MGFSSGIHTKKNPGTCEWQKIVCLRAVPSILCSAQCCIKDLLFDWRKFTCKTKAQEVKWATMNAISLVQWSFVFLWFFNSMYEVSQWMYLRWQFFISMNLQWRLMKLINGINTAFLKHPSIDKGLGKKNWFLFVCIETNQINGIQNNFRSAFTSSTTQLRSVRVWPISLNIFEFFFYSRFKTVDSNRRD